MRRVETALEKIPRSARKIHWVTLYLKKQTCKRKFFDKISFHFPFHNANGWGILFFWYALFERIKLNAKVKHKINTNGKAKENSVSSLQKKTKKQKLNKCCQSSNQNLEFVHFGPVLFVCSVCVIHQKKKKFKRAYHHSTIIWKCFFHLPNYTFLTAKGFRWDSII